MKHFGFTIIYQQKNKRNFHFTNTENENFIFQSKDNSTLFSFEYCKNNRFAKDKLFFQNEHFIGGIDGVVLNLQLLKNIYGISDWQELFIFLYKKHNKQIANHIVGEFAGFIFDKQKEEFIYFTNQTSSKKVFHHHGKDFTVIAPSVKTISQIFQAHNKKVNLNRTSAYSLLTYGGMYKESTLIAGVYRLHGGKMVIFKDKKLSLEHYLNYNNIEIQDKPEKDFIAQLEYHFQKALKLEYQKDEEYGHQHLATLSGGLDSRMNVCLAQQSGYKINNLCFSQSNHNEEKIARAIAESLNQPFTFVPLDGGAYLFDFEENMDFLEGQIFYTTSAHFNFALKKIDLKPFGLIHTGLIGDGILRTSSKKSSASSINLKDKLISKKLFPKIEKEMQELSTQFASNQVFNLHQRLFNIILSGSFVLEQYSYLVSPFMYPEFIKLCLTIPAKHKYQQSIYIKWLNQYHPSLNKFKWETTGFRPLYPWQMEASRYTTKMKILWHKFIRQSHKLQMVPEDYWYKNNPKIGIFWDSIFKEKITYVHADKELLADVNHLYQQGNNSDKTLILTLLGAIEKLKITT